MFSAIIFLTKLTEMWLVQSGGKDKTTKLNFMRFPLATVTLHVMGSVNCRRAAGYNGFVIIPVVPFSSFPKTTKIMKIK